MNDILIPATNFVIRGYFTTNGDGHAVVHIATCPRLRSIMNSIAGRYGNKGIGEHTYDYPRTNLRIAVRSFQNRWTVPVEMQLCGCTDTAASPITLDATVDYTGTHTAFHGRYRLSAVCDCHNCQADEDTYGPLRVEKRYVIKRTGEDGATTRMEHVRRESLTVVALPAPTK